MSLAITKKLAFCSTFSEVHKAVQNISEDLVALGYSQRTIFAIRLAVDEALNNAVRHGNSCDSKKIVLLEYSVDQDRFYSCITDQGLGFAPQDVPDPTQQENLQRPHGRGIFLMKAYMSRVEFNNRGNSVILVKHRNCTLPTLHAHAGHATDHPDQSAPVQVSQRRCPSS